MRAQVRIPYFPSRREVISHAQSCDSDRLAARRAADRGRWIESQHLCSRPIIRAGSTRFNGDVLVAQSNAPPSERKKGIRDWITDKVMGKAGAGVPSANRITLLRDADRDGVAELKSEYLSGLHSPLAWRWWE